MTVTVGVNTLVAVGGSVGDGVAVAVGVGVTVGVWATVGDALGVGVGHGLAMIVTDLSKGSWTPSSMSTRFSMMVSWAMMGLGPDMPKVIVTVVACSTKPAQRTALYPAL